MIEIDLQGEQLQLLPQKALWWAAQKTLIVADLHWGKSAHFRKHGIAIPTDTQSHDELRLAGLIRDYKAERLIIAGDLFHSRSNLQVEVFSHFRNAHDSLHIDLVIGNHDILPASKYTDWQLAQHQECFVVGPFCIAHDMLRDSDHFVIHGHVHPAVRLKPKGNHQPAVKLCCFAIDAGRMILPAFGQFTGTYVLESADYKHMYVIADDKVLQWK